MDTAIGYFEKAMYIYEKNHDTKYIANLYLQIGLAERGMSNIGLACASFDKSLQAYKAMLANGPELKVSLPREYATFEAGMLSRSKPVAPYK